MTVTKIFLETECIQFLLYGFQRRGSIAQGGSGRPRLLVVLGGFGNVRGRELREVENDGPDPLALRDVAQVRGEPLGPGPHVFDVARRDRRHFSGVIAPSRRDDLVASSGRRAPELE